MILVYGLLVALLLSFIVLYFFHSGAKRWVNKYWKTILTLGVVAAVSTAGLIIYGPDGGGPVGPVGAFDDSKYSYWRQITIESDDIESDLTNFPIMVYLSSDTNLSEQAQSDGGDISFCDDALTTQYNHEIENFTSSSGKLIAWVNVTSVSSSSDTLFRMYYGNDSLADQWDIVNTWDSDFIGVHHFNDSYSTATDNYKDSTSNNLDGTLYDTNTNATMEQGKIGQCINFSGTDDAIMLNSPTDYHNITVSGWLRTDNDFNQNDGIVARYYTSDGIRTGTPSTIRLQLRVNDTTHTDTDATYDNDTWYFAAITYDWDKVRYYYHPADVYDEDTAVGGGDLNYAASYYWGIGASSTWTTNQFQAYWNGSVDEVRFSKVARSGAWINATYDSTNQTPGFLTIGGVQVAGDDGITAYYVSNSGADSNDGSESTPWENVSKLNTEMNGGVIDVGDDIYFNRGDTFNDAHLEVRVGGTASDPMIIGAYGTGNMPNLTTPGSGMPNIFLRYDEPTNITIQNLNLTVDYGGLVYCILARDNLSNLTIKDCTLTEGGIFINNTDGYTIENVTMTETCGLVLYGSSYGGCSNGYIANSTLEGNESLDPERDIITLHREDGSGANAGDYHHFYNLSVWNASEDCLDLTAGRYIVVEDCEFYNGNHSTVSVGHDISNVTIQRCLLNVTKDTGAGGFSIGDSDDVIIRYNTIFNTTDEECIGLSTTDGSGYPGSDGWTRNLTVYNNNFVYPPDWGYETNRMVATSSAYLNNVTIKNNIIADLSSDTTRLYWVYGTTIPTSENYVNVTYDGNMWHDPGGMGTGRWYNGTSLMDLADWQGFYPNDVFDDPELADVSNNDLTLNATSPCIDSGSWLTVTDGGGTGTWITVVESSYFTDGYGLIGGDAIFVGDDANLQIVEINYSNETIQVDRTITWVDNENVSLNRYTGDKVDIGANEHNAYFIGPEGDNGNPGTILEPWETLDYSMTQVSAGDTVYMLAGVYSTEVYEEVNYGTSSNWITYTSYGDGEVILDGDGNGYDGWSGVIYMLNAKYVRISDFTIRNSPNFGIYIAVTAGTSNTHNVTIDNCTLDNITSGGIVFYGSSGYPQSDLIIENNTLGDCQNAYAGARSQEGLTISICERVECTNNYLFDQASNAGIDVKNSCSWVNVTHNRVNTTNRTGASSIYGIYIDAGLTTTHNITFSNNMVWGKGVAFAVASEAGGELHDITYTNNIFTGVTGGASALMKVDNYGGGGTHLKTNFSFINNIGNSSDYGIRNQEDDDKCFDWIIRNNVFDTNQGFTTTYVDWDKHSVDHNLFNVSSSDYWGSDEINASPEWVDPANWDFNLTASSECIGAGFGIGAPALDYYGNSRINEVDIGVSEYQSFDGDWFGNQDTFDWYTSIEDAQVGSPATPTYNGTGVNITVRVWTDGDYTIKAALYDNSTERLLYTTEERTINTASSWSWEIFNFTEYTPLYNDTEYLIVAYANDSATNNCRIAYSSSGGDWRSIDYNTYPGWSDPFVKQIDNNAVTYMIYCNYTANSSYAGPDWYVDDTGSDTNHGGAGSPFATVQKGVNVTRGGHSVNIMEGIYNPSARITVENKDNVTIQNYESDSVEINGSLLPHGPDDVGQAYINASIWLMYSNYTRITGITLNNSSCAGIAVRSAPCNNLTVDNCSITNSSSFAFRSSASYDTTFEFNYLYDNHRNWSDHLMSQEAISFVDVDGFSINNNTLINNRGENIDMKSGCSKGEACYNEINTTGNYLSKILNMYGGMGIYIDARGYSHNISIFNNLIYGNQTGIEIGTETTGGYENISVYNNIVNITNETGGGVTTLGRIPLLLHNQGASDGPFQDVDVYSNTFATDEDIEVYTGLIHVDEDMNYTNTQDIRFFNNICYTENLVAGGWLFIVYSTDESEGLVTFSNNSFFHEGDSDCDIHWNGSNYNNISNPEMFGDDANFLDPELADYANGDFHLNNTSPCIGKGNTTLISTRDYDEVLRSVKGTYCIGALENDASVDWYVNGSSGSDSDPGTLAEPFLTIQKASDMATCGDTVHIMYGDGEYLPPNGQVNITGINQTAEWTTFRNYQNDYVLIDGSNCPTTYSNGINSVIEVHESNYIRITGLHINHSQSTGIALGVAAGEDPVSYIRIDNCSITNSTGGAIKSKGGNDNITFEWNYLYDNFNNWTGAVKSSQETVSFETVDTFSINNNTLINNRAENIDVKGGCYNGEICYNEINNTGAGILWKQIGSSEYYGGPAIMLDARGYSHNISIFNNLVYGNATGISINNEISSGYYENISVYNNIVNISKKGDITSLTTPDVLILGNSGGGSNMNGHIYIYSNTFYSGSTNDRNVFAMGHYSINQLDDSNLEECYIYNNIFASDYTGSSTCLGGNFLVPGDLYMANNSYYRSSGTLKNRWGQSDYTNQTAWNFGWDALYDDPEFVNMANEDGDWHLNSTSPLIDKGNTTYISTRDFDDVLRSTDGYTIGAYESGADAWKIVNGTSVIILRLTMGGNLYLAGTLYESQTAPGAFIFKMNDSLWLQDDGDLYIAGTETTVSTPIWKILNIDDVAIWKFDTDGNLEVAGTIYENT
jgi:hypothetical protein